MSNATELQNEIMAMIMKKMESGQAEYADIFGALSCVKAFFEVEYAGRMTATWKSVLDEEK